ncbi:hypothetical protein ACLOJK_006461 [Asimina triloba]
MSTVHHELPAADSKLGVGKGKNRIDHVRVYPPKIGNSGPLIHQQKQRARECARSSQHNHLCMSSTLKQRSTANTETGRPDPDDDHRQPKAIIRSGIHHNNDLIV